MDAASQTCKVFNPIAEQEYFSVKSREFGIICEENKQIEERIGEIKRKNGELKQRLLILNPSAEEKFQWLEDFYVAERHLSKTNLHNDFSYNIYRSIMGYAFALESWNAQKRQKLITWYYNEKCFVCIAMASNGQKELIKVEPAHRNFLEMRKLLMLNQDVKGLLASLFKYFNFLEKSLDEM